MYRLSQIKRAKIRGEIRSIMEGADPNAPPFKAPIELTNRYGRFDASKKSGPFELTGPLKESSEKAEPIITQLAS